MRYVVIGALMLLTASLRPAGATGVCEDTPRRYDPPVRYSPTEKRLAFAGSQDFCNETETPPVVSGGQGDTVEERGTVHFIELRDLKNTVVERLASARGETMTQVSAAVDKVKTVPSGKMESTLKARGFVPIAAGMKSPAGGCTVRTLWQRADTQNGFPAGVLTAEVVSRKKVITAVDLGLVAQKRNSEVALRASFLANEKALLLWSRIPQCVGGPPPGHFDKSDPGSCYAGDDITIQLLTVAAHPELASCFPPVAAPP